MSLQQRASAAVPPPITAVAAQGHKGQLCVYALAISWGVGLTAQEVELYVPEVVDEWRSDKIKYVSYGPNVELEAINEEQKK